MNSGVRMLLSAFAAIAVLLSGALACSSAPQCKQPENQDNCAGLSDGGGPIQDGGYDAGP